MQNAKALIIYVSLHLHIRCRWRLRRRRRRLDIEEKTITTRSILEGSAKGSERHIQGKFFESQFVYRRPASAVAGYLSVYVHNVCVFLDRASELKSGSGWSWIRRCNLKENFKYLVVELVKVGFVDYFQFGDSQDQ